jgi:S-DNA-T family DNA segregation ATPase FtsK/SpoIIIE
VAGKGTARKKGRVSRLKIVAFALLGLAALTGLSLLSFTRDPLAEGLIALLRRLFGWGVYFVPIAVGIVGFWLLLESMGTKPGLVWRRPLGAVLLLLASLPTLHLLSFPEDGSQLAAQGGGGGYAGWLLSQALETTVGTIGAYITLGAALAAGLILLSGISLSNIGALLKRACTAVRDLYRARAFRVTFHWPDITPRNLISDRRLSTLSSRFAAPPTDQSLEETIPLGTSPSSGGKEWHLPSLEDILEQRAERTVSETEIRRKIGTIEETLRSFGVPGRVVEVNQGPTVSQFGVEPGYVERKGRDGRLSRAKVKVSQIGSLAKDLSLALAAAPIRIEAPVPGRSMIGIEVPNDEAHVVPLRRIMESDEFTRMTSRLKIALGQDVSGGSIVTDLGKMPHLLIAGATGSGKSVCINSIVTCLLLSNTPQELRLMMIDPKMVELVNFNGIPHLLSPVVVEAKQVVGTLRWLLREMDRRYELFSAVQARNVDDYNRSLVQEGGQPLPYIVVLMDELADLMLASPDEVESSLCRLAQMSRATGIHLVVATQRPSVDVVTGLIKANFPARISFAVTSQADSRVILDTGGAERLLGKGDMLYIAANSSHPVRLQGCFVSDSEIESLVRFWRGMEVPQSAKKEDLVQQPLWPDMATVAEDDVAEEDPLLEDAIDLVRRERRASTTFLQRRLQIGYVRAARLMDMLEEKDIIGPPESAGRARNVLYEEEALWPPT